MILEPIPGWVDYPLVSLEGIPTSAFLMGLISFLVILIATVLLLLFESFPSSASKAGLMDRGMVEHHPGGSQETEELADLVTAGKEEENDY